MSLEKTCEEAREMHHFSICHAIDRVEKSIEGLQNLYDRIKSVPSVDKEKEVPDRSLPSLEEFLGGQAAKRLNVLADSCEALTANLTEILF